MFSLCRWLALLLLTPPVLVVADGAPFLRDGDIVSLVGGEDLVAAAEQGDLELALTLGQPSTNLHFRSLAREGDTVVSQLRDLNYPPLEQQLETVGTTVIIAEFGSMENLSGMAAAEFTAAYGRLLDRLAPGGRRRVVLIEPPISTPFREAVAALAQRRHLLLIAPGGETPLSTRDGVHLDAAGQRRLAQETARVLEPMSHPADAGKSAAVHELIQAKNRLWFYYYRPQNWAFLAGDRISQPSSHDNLDPTKRWFPVEMEQFLPLIAGREAQIRAALAP